jgi:hypothetical protein
MFKYHIPEIIPVLQCLKLQFALCVFQDNINVFLKSCRETFGLGNNQLFDIGDLEDLSQRAIAE